MRSFALTALTLLFLVLGNRADVPPITWRVESLSNAELPPCSSHSTSQTLMNAVKDAPGITDYSLIVTFIKGANPGVPTCAQMDQLLREDAGTPMPFFSTPQPKTWDLPTAVEQNSALDLPNQTPLLFTPFLRFVNEDEAITIGEGKRAAIEESVIGLRIPTGMALFLLRKPGFGIYYFKDFGGYIGCHASCELCTGPNKAECSQCYSWANRMGGDIDTSLSGRCFCPTGNFNQAGTQCDTSACHSSCKNCEGPTASDCIECADGFTSSAYLPQDMRSRLSSGLRDLRKH